VNLTASRVDLGFLTLCILFVAYVMTVGSPQRFKWRVPFFLAIMLLAFAVDWLTPKPLQTMQATTVPKTPTAAEIAEEVAKKVPRQRDVEKQLAPEHIGISDHVEVKVTKKALPDSLSYEHCKDVFLGVIHQPTELPVYMPPNSHITVSAGKLSPDAAKRLEEMNQDFQRAVCRLKYVPADLTLHDLYATDFSSLGGNSSVEHGSFTITNDRTGSVTPIGYAIVEQLDTATKFLAFYIRYSNETSDLAAVLADRYQDYLNSNTTERFTAKVPGDSEELDSRDLVFSKRIYIYHENYLSPEDTIKVRNAYRRQGISVIFRSVDYLAMRQLQAQLTKAKSKD
jgi:hypothetical protein